MKFSVKKVRDSVTPQINAIKKAFNDNSRRQILSLMGKEFIRQTRSNFGQSGDYRPSPWAPLSPKYAKRVGRTVATLKQSGALYESIKMNPVHTNWVEIYTKNPYAAAHTMGYGPNNLPARNFWPAQIINADYVRILRSSQEQIEVIMMRELVLRSSGALPFIINHTRMIPSYGNIFQPATGQI